MGGQVFHISQLVLVESWDASMRTSADIFHKLSSLNFRENGCFHFSQLVLVESSKIYNEEGGSREER